LNELPARPGFKRNGLTLQRVGQSSPGICSEVPR
jgi:hypothetical protein